MVSGRKVWHMPHTKSGKSWHVILNAMAIDILDKLPRVDGNPYLFPGKVPGNPYKILLMPLTAILKGQGSRRPLDWMT